ncbi:MAG TPA: EamA family transporter [Gammaproteobacteria bacterium]|nr:EamA family transporter [Gammaproteobacteria bacterium]
MAVLLLPPMNDTREARHRLWLMAAFAVVYVVWGSTYLAIRIGVRDIPPALFAGVRNSIAGLLLIVFACACGQRLPFSGREWLHALVMGVLLVTLGNGLVTWGEVYVQSNQAALIVTTSALWVAWFGTFGAKGHQLTLRVKIGLLTGFAGAVLMLLPGKHFSVEHFGAQFMILCSAICWGAGVMYGRNVAVSVSPLMHSGMLLFIGGALLVVIGLAGGEASAWHWSLRGIGALVYLTLIGSCLTYTTYVWLIKHTTPDKLSTTAYVNPAIALVLGWLVLDETLSGMRLLGMLVILLGVILVTTRYGTNFKRLMQTDS